MGAGVLVRVSRRDLRAAEVLVARIARGAYPAAVHAAAALSLRVRESLRIPGSAVHQAAAGSQPVAALTQAKRRMGKRPGVTPAIPTYPGVRPLVASRRYLNGIELTRAVSPTMALFAIAPAPGQRSADGRLSLAELAGIHEFGAVLQVPLTGPALRYLAVLKAGRAGPSEGPTSPTDPPDRGVVRRTVTVMIPARPIWRTAATRALREDLPKFTSDLARAMVGVGVPAGTWRHQATHASPGLGRVSIGRAL